MTRWIVKNKSGLGVYAPPFCELHPGGCQENFSEPEEGICKNRQVYGEGKNFILNVEGATKTMGSAGV